MSKSRKRFPGGTWCCCKSQKRGKQIASKRFRRTTTMLIHQQKFDKLPLRSIEITCPYDLGGDGKAFYGFHPECDWYAKVMRK